MSTALNDDIANDFLVESSEIAAGLGEELLALERGASDPDRINAVFRGFHTIKGGAGFLELSPIVDLCHLAEDLVGQLRDGKRSLDAATVDHALEAADELQRMLARFGAGEALEPAPDALLDALRAPPCDAADASLSATPDADALEAEFEQAACAFEQAASDFEPAPGTNGDEISDDEFEDLLDSLHSAGSAAPGEVQGPASVPPPGAPRRDTTQPTATVPAQTSVRVDTGRLDTIMNLVGELVLARNRIKSLRDRLGDDELDRACGSLDQVTSRLQDAVMRTRMQPVAKVFSRFPRLARDVARKLGKSVRVELRGEDTDLDKNLVEELADPLIHLVRNAIDHGIESPEQRAAAGKPDEGLIRLSACQEGDQILIAIEDDGGGIEAEALRRRAIEKALITAQEAARLDEAGCHELMFLPGFSTREAVSEVSGRGVGMDVVRSAIARLGGQVSVQSRPGQGSCFRIRVPLTLAILPALMVEVDGRRHALALACVTEVLAMSQVPVTRIDGETVLDLREEAVPVIDLRDWFGGNTDAPAAHLVVVQVAGRRYALAVNSVCGREEVVVKPLGRLLQGLSGIAGATITGSGAIALILDLPGLLATRGYR